MPKTEIKNIIKKYASRLKRGNFPVSAVYLFGSYAKGKENKWSDIDIAVISDKLKRNWERNYNRMLDETLEVDDRIEPHGFTKEDFKNLADPLVYEIRKTGVRIV